MDYPISLNFYVLSSGPPTTTTTCRSAGKVVRLLYPFTHTLAPGVEISLVQDDNVVIVKELGDSHFMVNVPGPFGKTNFPISRNVLDM